MSLFRRGFVKYLDSGEFSDLDLVVLQGEKDEPRVYHVHRIVLVSQSDFFKKLLTSDFKEAQQDRIELNFPDPHHIFPDVLSFMYRGGVGLEITWKNVIPLLSLADSYLIPGLVKQCRDFLSTGINRSNALTVLHQAIEADLAEVVDKCVEIISKNFTAFGSNSDWTFLPVDAFMKLLSNEYLAVRNEYELYSMVVEYIEAHQPAMSDDDITSAMGFIRFRWMTVSQLNEVVHNPLVPRDLVIEALMSRVAHSEEPELALTMQNKRLEPRISFGMQFEYVDDFDENGIIHWISTDGLSKSWENSHKTGLVKVNSSSIERGSLENLVARQPSDLWTKDVPASWISLALKKNRTIAPSHYSLRHGANYSGDFLRTWDFQGSIDGHTWVLLRRHASDTSLNTPFGVCTWELETRTPYRFFRILQTGHNSSGHNFLVIGGLELYGELYETTLSENRTSHHL